MSASPLSTPLNSLTICSAALITLAVAAVSLSAGPQPPASPLPAAQSAVPLRLSFTDLAGKTYTVADLARNKATVFVFSNTECPLAAKYTPRILALHREYSRRGIGFFLVNSNLGDSTEAFARWAKERKYPFPLVKDRGTELADLLHASATPEAVVVGSEGTTVYLGRIDDSVDPARVGRRDLAEALNDLLAGNPVRVARTRAAGCEIFRDKQPLAVTRSGKTSRFTWARDIAPILDANCVVCHRKGDVGPMALDSYAQARLWAPAIKDYTTRRLMPPWKAVGGQDTFHDARWLTDTQVATIAEWADGKTPQGNLKELPPAVQRHPAGQWPLGTPDVVLQPTGVYHLAAEGEDVYRNFTLPIDFEQDRYVSAFDFMPGNRAIVHHMIAYIDVTGESARQQDNRESEPGWSVSGGGSGIKNDDWGDGWAPGMQPRRLEPGVAVKIPRGAKLVLQVHYHKTGKVEEDRSSLALYWAKTPAEKVLQTVPVGNGSFVLKPGVADQEVKASIVLPFSATIRQLLPHMHLLGKEMEAVAVLPDGTSKPLIRIKNWEFNWQMNYRFKEPVELPRGTRINVVAKYDNTAGNPNQPNHPPREARYGEQTTDEMCFLFLGFTRN